MKFATFSFEGQERIGVQVEKDRILDLNRAYICLLHEEGEPKPYELASIRIPPNMVDFLKGGEPSIEAARCAIRFAAGKKAVTGPRGERVVFKIHEVKLMAPVLHPPKIPCLIANYRVFYPYGISLPHHPLFFVKTPICVIGPNDHIEIPDIGPVHQEVELAIVIGKPAYRVSKEKALEVVAGYTILNDITASKVISEDVVNIKLPTGVDRETGLKTFEDFTVTTQERAKNYNTFAPVGPWLVTKDEIKDPHNLELTCKVDGKVLQRGNTKDMIFRIPDIIEFLSNVFTLEAGDIIATGSCGTTDEWAFRGVDLRAMGGVLESEIEGIGILRNPIRAI